MVIPKPRIIVELMEPPLKPSESDCCNSGCNPCILDVYEEQLEKFKNRSLSSSKELKRNCISKTTYTIFKLIKIVEHTKDTSVFTFQYVKGFNESTIETVEQLSLFYKPGQHFLLKDSMYCNENDHFTRAYTPIPIGDNNSLTFTVIVKLYEHGMMSKFIKRLKVDNETIWRGPYGSFEINYSLPYIFLIAQGTGIAPLFAVIRDILNNLECETFLKLFFCCRTEEDILLRNELYELSSFWNFSYEVFLTNPGDVKYKYNECVHLSRLKCEEIETYVKDKLNGNIQVLICGSEIFNQDMLQNVVACGIDPSKVFLF